MNNSKMIELELTLTEAMDEWWRGIDDTIASDVPLLGENSFNYMARAALAVLLAIEEMKND